MWKFQRKMRNSTQTGCGRPSEIIFFSPFCVTRVETGPHSSYTLQRVGTRPRNDWHRKMTVRFKGETLWIDGCPSGPSSWMLSASFIFSTLPGKPGVRGNPLYIRLALLQPKPVMKKIDLWWRSYSWILFGSNWITANKHFCINVVLIKNYTRRLLLTKQTSATVF